MTLFDTVYDLFFKRVVNDPDFFQYTNVPQSEALELCKINAFDYMIESISTINENCTPTVNFNDYDILLSQFNFDMTNSEMQMLVNLMFEKFLSRDMAKLKIYNKFFTNSEVALFSPANERKTFMEMLDGLILKNIKAIKSYGSRDRLTGELVTVGSMLYDA